MTNANASDPVTQLHQDLGFKRLNPLWAKLEIVLGLFAVAGALLGGMQLAARPAGEDSWQSWGIQCLLFVFGGYLALAGHRSHLYQSNNRLAAHLADLIRKHSHGG